MLTDVFTAVILRDPDLELTAAASDDPPDVVVTDIDRSRDDGLLWAVTARPTARLVGISFTSGSATLYELRPRRVPLGVLGLDDLAGVLARRVTP